MSKKVLDNKCPACGAPIAFNPKNQKWDCEYCGSKFTLEEMQKYNNASTIQANKQEKLVVEESKEKMDVDVYRCENCGAEIMADETTTATFCVYCGSTAILKSRINKGRAPNYIIPFKKVKEDAALEFQKLIKKKPLAPKCFKDPKNIEKVTGVYIPFWAYDIDVSGRVSFNCRDVSTWSDSKYVYTKTDRYFVEKDGHFEYDKVLADASSRFPDDLMDSIEPFQYEELVEYNHAFLAGFFAEKYDVDENNGYERVSTRTNNSSVSMIENTIGHQSKTLRDNGMIIKAKKVHYIMLPVWMMNIRYKDKNYTFAMNGQTGKIVGDIPIGGRETLLWTMGIFIVSFVVILIIVLLGRTV